jgi:hypothetical protein
MHTHTIDPLSSAAHVMFVELEFGEAFFDEYSWLVSFGSRPSNFPNLQFSRGTGAVIGVNVKLLLESIKSIQAADVVWVSATQDETIVIVSRKEKKSGPPNTLPLQKARRGSSTKFELVVTQITLLGEGMRWTLFIVFFI